MKDLKKHLLFALVVMQVISAICSLMAIVKPLIAFGVVVTSMISLVVTVVLLEEIVQEERRKIRSREWLDK